MYPESPVSLWINQLQQGDRDVVEALWQAYFPKLVRLASNKLHGLPTRLVEPEDIALSAFNSFCLAAEKRRFPKLADRDDLWQILVRIIRNKSATAWEHHTRAKRDFNRVTHQVLEVQDGESDEVSFFKVVLRSEEPDPGMAAEVAEQCDHLLRVLPDEQLRQIALFKMEGYSNAEIATKLGCAPITIDRRLGVIRKTWLSNGAREAIRDVKEDSPKNG